MKKIARKFFNLIGVWVASFPHSGKQVAIYMFTRANNPIISDHQLIKTNNFFEFLYFYQIKDFRGFESSKWNEETTRIFAMHKVTKFLKNFDYFDIGANYGLYSLPLLSSGTGARVLIEPNPFVFKCLEKTYQQSEFEILNKAITSGEEKISLQLMPHCSGGSSSIFKSHRTLITD